MEQLVNNSPRETWLHGWPRIGVSVLIGTSIHCAGCGSCHGVTTVAFDEGWEHWVKDRPYPDWPFNEKDCPLCLLSDPHRDQGPNCQYIQVGVDGIPVRNLRGKLPK